MGEVVEAGDLELGEQVALKFLRPEQHSDPQALERFRRELRLARKVTHPNVCRLFDVGRAEVGGRTVDFLTMQLLGGESLADRLERAGRLRPEEALPLVRQMAAGLAAAHEAGVIHRDFKAANVMLVPCSGGERAVVTDFGLARVHTAGPSDGTLTRAGDIVGTPAYMAPEQVEGLPVTPATDVYALGIVLYEMVTGRRPFDGDTPFECALRRVVKPPPSPRTLVQDLDPRWEDVILRCLSREPANRPALEEIARALGDPSAPLPSPRAPRRWLPIAVALALLALAGTTGALLWRGVSLWRSSPDGTRAAKTLSRPAVAVLGFVDLGRGAESAWLGNALTETLGGELATSPRLRQVSGEEAARARADLSLADVSTLSPATLSRVRSLTGADLVVGGTYLLSPGPTGGRAVRLQVNVQGTRDGERRAGFAEEGTEAELFELIRRAGRRLREELTGEAGEAAATLLSSFDGSQEAARRYAEGMARLREFDAQAARQLLEEAARLAPGSPLVHLGLADAWDAVGRTTHAVEAARRAQELSASLPDEQKRLVEGRVAELGRDWPRAIEVYSSLVRDVPDSLEHGLRLGEAQIAAGRPADALETAEAAHRRLPSPLREDPRIDLLEGRAAYYAADYRRQLEAARRAERTAKRLGARLVEARALDVAGSAMRLLGDLDGAMASLQRARAMYAAVGSRFNVARVLNIIGNVLYGRNDLAGAIEAYETAVAELRAIGDQQRLGLQLHNLAWGVLTGGDVARAHVLMRESIAALRATEDRKELAIALGKLAPILVDEGDLSGARKALGESVRLAAESGRKASQAVGLAQLGHVLRQAGDLSGARDAYDASVRVYRELAGAGAGPNESTETPLLVEVETGDAAAVVRRLEKAQLTPASSELDMVLPLLGALARAQASTGDAEAAGKTLAGARERIAGSPNPRYAIQVATCDSFVRRAAGDASGALRLAADARRAAEAGGFVPLILEARLEEALALRDTADPGAGERLRALARDARVRGFLLVATRADAALAAGERPSGPRPVRAR